MTLSIVPSWAREPSVLVFVLVLVGPCSAPVRAVEAMDSPVALPMARARQAQAEGRHEDARALFQTAMDADPKLLLARAGVSQALVALGRADEAARVLEAAPAADAGHPDLLLARARVDIARSRPAEAMALIDQVAARYPDRPEIPYLRGMSRLRSGRYQEAARDLSRVPEQAGSLGQSASILRGVSLSRSGQTSQARDLLDRVARSSSNVSSVAERLSLQLSSGPSAAVRKKTRGTLRLGVQVDDNPVIAPTTNVFGLADRRQSSVGTTLNGVVSHDLGDRPDRGMTISYAFLQTLNFRLHEVDVQDHAMSATHWRNGETGGHPYQIGLQASHDTILVDQRAFMSRQSLAPYATMQFSPRSSTTLVLRGQNKDFLNEPAFSQGTVEDRDATNLQLGLSHTQTVGKRGHRATVGFQFDEESADGRHVDYTGLRWHAGLAGRLGDRRLTFSTQVSLHARQYDHTNLFFGPRRDDDDSSIYGGLTWALSGRRQITLEHSINRNVSNIALFDYRREVTALAYQMSF